jgi:hypothetical protein
VAAVRRNSKNAKRTLYASWNGATEVAHWEVHVGRRESELRPVGIAARRGFETAIALGATDGYAKLVALDAAGKRLGASKTIRL